jgi:hypothetical protein
MGEPLSKQVTFNDLTFTLALYGQDDMKITLTANSY